jgi:glycosyltransferase involved in cell wall biosynthesis
MIPICHVQVLPILSGVQRAMLEIFRHLDRNRFEPHVVCQGAGPLSVELARLDIPCHFVPSLGRPIHPWRDAVAYRSLFRVFRQQRFQLVHTHSSKPGILARVAARRAGVPWVIHHVHSFAFHEFSSWQARALYSRLEAWAGRYCDKVIFVNHEERELSIRERLLPETKCLTIHNGVDLRKFTPAECQRRRPSFRAEHRLRPDELAILFMGRLETQKQPLILPAIVERLEELVPRAAWRVLVAGSGPLESELTRRIGRLKLRHRVQLIGWQPEPHVAFHGSDLVLQPSLWEGLPLTLIEGQAAGLPIVAADVKGNREVVTSRTGFLCEPCDPQAYVEPLARLIADAELRHRLGQAGRAQIVRHFDGDVNMRRVNKLYLEHFFGAQIPARRAA